MSEFFLDRETLISYIFSFFRKLGENLIQVIDATTFSDTCFLFAM